MGIKAWILGAAVALTPLAVAADNLSSQAVGYICSAEQAPAPVGPRQLVMVPGMGSGGFPILTRSPEAQAWFDYGLKLAHAFYHEDAKAAFAKALALDPGCAMCAWGEAWADGPTINFGVEDDQAKAAAALADKAAQLGAGESPKNLALIGALKRRYGSHDAAADLAFAKAMDAAARRYPEDSELAVMTADAWLIPATLHDDRQGVGRSIELLKAVLAAHPDDTGAIHFYIHATEIAGQAADALPYAERLGGLAPGASHLVHMASHTFFRVGRYEDAAVSNAQAIAVDGAYLRAAHDAVLQGKVPYHSHNLKFGLGGALASGDAPLALRLADHAGFAFPKAIAEEARAQGVISQAYAAYGRYAPDRALALADPGKGAAFAQAMRHYARGEALAARGDAAGVRAEAAQVVAAPAALAAMDPYFRTMATAVTQVAQLTLEGRAAMIEGRPRDAATAYRAAMAIQDARLTGPEYQDPPPWWFPERRSLAAALLASGDPAQAIKLARQALVVWPNEPLTLTVLGQAELAAGQGQAAQRDLALARKGWRGGETPLARL